MKKNKYIQTGLAVCVIITTALYSCKKYEEGFLSPYFQYPLKQYEIIKGRVYTSDAINPDGSSIPFTIKLVHIYDENGKIADDVMLKPYPVIVWTASYNSATDTTIDAIVAKQSRQEIPAININPANGAIEANAATSNLPAGIYTLDLQVTNSAGMQEFKDIVSFILEDGPSYETAPDIGSNYERLIKVGDETQSVTLPQIPEVTIKHTAASPNLIILKMLDQNNVPFNPSKGEIVKRPNTGLNPIPPYLQNLEAYTHSYEPTDTSMNFPFALLPMPYASLGNGYNMYYRIPTQFFHVDGYNDGDYSLNIRFPIRFYEAGTYNVTIKLPGITRK